MTVRYVSNKQKVGDGMWITRVSGGGALFEVWTGAAWSAVEAVADAPPVNTAPVGADVTLHFEVPNDSL